MPGLLRGVARTAVVAGTATAVSNRVSRRQGNRWAAQEEQQYEQYAQPEYAQPQYAQPQYAPPPASPGGDMQSKLEQLERLGELKAQGLLNEVEFEKQKALILNS
jgi:hypothetical protein